MGRIVAIDWGTKRIGIAQSDIMGILASPQEPILAKKTVEETVKLIINTYPDCEAFVLGLPLLLSGEDSDSTVKARAFAEKLKELSGKDVHLWDERLTSKQVERTMIEGGVKRKKRTPHVDSLSATLILQNYLDRN